MTTNEIRLNFYKGTGLKYDFDKIVEVYKDANKEDKIQLFRELQWKAPAGIISTGSPKATYIANALTALAEELGLTLPDLDENGILDSNERWIKTKIDILEDSDNEGNGEGDGNNDDNKDNQDPQKPEQSEEQEEVEEPEDEPEVKDGEATEKTEEEPKEEQLEETDK